MVWIPLSHFLFYGFYQSLTYKEVKKVGVRTIFFHLWTIMDLFGSQIFSTFALWKVKLKKYAYEQTMYLSNDGIDVYFFDLGC